MDKKVLIMGIIVFLVIIGSGYYLLSNSKTIESSMGGKLVVSNEDMKCYKTDSYTYCEFTDEYKNKSP